MTKQTHSAESLLGTWSGGTSGGFAVQDFGGNVSTGRGGSGYGFEFNTDGTYSSWALFDIVMTRTTISIYEEGAYQVQGDALTLTPKRKVYRRNGVDEGDELKVRSFKWRIEPHADPSKRNLILSTGESESVYTQ